METSRSYLDYVSAMQEYQPLAGRVNAQAPFSEAFESIYAKTSDDVTLQSAKTLLLGLSTEELRTLQHYHGLADPIDVNILENEAAYNLLMHDSEKYDFNNNGYMEVGIGKSSMPVPKNMPADVRDAYIKAINTLDESDQLMAIRMFTLDINLLSSQINGTKYEATRVDYAYLKSSVESILNPKPPAFSSEEVKASATKFWETFEDNYAGERDVSESEERDPEIEKFLEALCTKGAAQFLADLNQEKIDEKVEKYRQELLEKMGDSPDVLAEIEELVSEYRKQLMEELRNGLDSSDKTAMTPDDIAMIRLLMDQTRVLPPLGELLQRI